FLDTLAQLKRSHIVVIGTEAHVCVLQTCLDLLQQGYAVTVAADAVASRNTEHKAIALEQLRQAGAIVSCVETIIFQWTTKAGTSTFKQILPIVK
ncbi:MAG: isochorismatase family protein, partial [Pseudoalteromonas spongiae]